jgi:IS5 family transposase
MEIGRIARTKGGERQERLTRAYQQLFAATSRVVGQAKRFAQEIRTGVKRTTDVIRQAALDAFRQELDTFVPRVQQVLRQARARIVRGDTRAEHKLLSLFEPSTEVIRKGKAGKPNEFGKLVKLQEAEQQIITHYEVYDQRPSDTDLLLPAIEAHTHVFGRVPRLVTADAGFYSAANEDAAHAKGVTRVSIPNRSTKSAARKREQKKRWFKNGQRWRTGCEGRISVVKRRHGLNRSRYKGDDGMKRWVGLGVIADNVINIGRVLATRPRT